MNKNDKFPSDGEIVEVASAKTVEAREFLESCLEGSCVDAPDVGCWAAAKFQESLAEAFFSSEPHHDPS